MKYIILYARKLQEHNLVDRRSPAIVLAVIGCGVTLCDPLFMPICACELRESTGENGSEKFSSLGKKFFQGSLRTSPLIRRPEMVVFGLCSGCEQAPSVVANGTCSIRLSLSLYGTFAPA
jgi:hypothetical protein